MATGTRSAIRDALAGAGVCGTVGTTIVANGTRSAIRDALAGAGVCGTVGTTIVANGTRSAIRDALAGAGVCGTVGTTIVATGIRSAIRDALARIARLAGDVIVVDCHAVTPSSQAPPTAPTRRSSVHTRNASRGLRPTLHRVVSTRRPRYYTEYEAQLSIRRSILSASFRRRRGCGTRAPPLGAR